MKDQWEKLPIFKKAIEINNLVEHLTEAVEKTEIKFEKKNSSRND